MWLSCASYNKRVRPMRVGARLRPKESRHRDPKSRRLGVQSHRTSPRRLLACPGGYPESQYYNWASRFDRQGRRPDRSLPEGPYRRDINRSTSHACPKRFPSLTGWMSPGLANNPQGHRNARCQRKSVKCSKSLGMSGWEAGIRTPIRRSRVCSLTVRRPPNEAFILSNGGPANPDCAA